MLVLIFCFYCHIYRYATVEKAVKALKIDILRTFQARLEMHCDNLVGDEIQGDELPILHEPPRRVNTKLCYTQITVFYFLLPGEAQEESVKAVADMLGFTPNFEHLDVGAGNRSQSPTYSGIYFTFLQLSGSQLAVGFEVSCSLWAF